MGWELVEKFQMRLNPSSGGMQVLALCSVTRKEWGPDEDRTKSLKTALEVIWKKIDPSSPIFQRYPFVEGAPIVPLRRHGNKGRFISERDPIG